ncbi:ankyrin-3-like protein isoform X1 [Cinnamomum micranthum f. kanehirae]|uniref:Ankyrin-3-like protein isoform X1 n=1 Tax=Cinnamomum micranthum f. kanehirae TaxID=337451 RepID=A0A3S4PEY7_9MAGN|nr:ankyrin-3-like protein isoform X1 [Cinnamomum micranthum f. kanehirae]
MARKAVVDELSMLSQRLIEAALRGDADCVAECLSGGGGSIDVNYIGTVSLKVKCTETLLHEEEADEVKFEYAEFKTDVTALFAAAHSGHVEIARKLLAAGAYINQELFRGYATTAAAREGHCDLLGLLLKAGASQLACEDALLEASLCGQAKAAELLICSEMTRHDAAAHALVSASCRGFVDVVTVLIKNGVNINCMDRVLLRSAKPTLLANVNCTPLVSAIVSRQASIMKYLLEAGARMDCQVQLGAWSWDTISGEELRVGACLGEPYNEAWCAIEFYEASGHILKLLLNHQPLFLEDQHRGRTLLCHAILCRNTKAVRVLLEAGANVEFVMRTEKGHKSRPLHLASRLGCLPILKQLIEHGCEVDARTETGQTALMLAAKADNADCFLQLVNAGADLGLVSSLGETAVKLAEKSLFGSSVVDILSQAFITRRNVCSTSLDVFSPLHFFADTGNAELLQMILRLSTADLNKQDGSGSTPLTIAAKAGHAEAFRILVMAGADVRLKTRDGETVVSILQSQAAASDRDRFEQILLDAILGYIVTDHSVFRALHYAARKGDSSAIVQLLKMGFPVNSLDEDGYSPLMVAAREGNADACKLFLLQGGADCGLVNHLGETALSVARGSSKCKLAEGVILDHMARSHVLAGESLYKHTREGRGTPHVKAVRMLKLGMLTWGASTRRNVVCKEASAGPSMRFQKNIRKGRGDGKGVIFRVLTVTGREVHFEADCTASLELWVRGINLISKEAAAGA